MLISIYLTDQERVKTMSLKKTSLYYREGSSDKEYHVSVEPRGNLWVVSIQYGRRGSKLQTGTKTNSPVSETVALEIFEKLKKEKQSKGYTEHCNSLPYEKTDKEHIATDIYPQLLNHVDETEVKRLLEDDNWCAQEKLDGKRILIRNKGGLIDGINRRGLIVSLPDEIRDSALSMKQDYIMDGELLSNRFVAFDVLARGTDNLKSQPYQTRYQLLSELINSSKTKLIRCVETAWDSENKKILLNNMRDSNKEGIVFKKIDSLYVAGRPNNGGSQVKHKFYATLTARVSSINAQRSVEISVIHENRWFPAGNVTIPSNFALPKVNKLVEIKYLYAFQATGRLFQPIYLGVRDDLVPQDCSKDQLKYKNTDEEDLDSI